MSEIKTNDSAANAPDSIRRWSRQFAEAHDCPVTLSREASGYHLYLPCPECLHTHGRKELDDPKYSINLSMLAGLGDEFRDTTNNSFMPADIADRDGLAQRKENASSICMRTRSARHPHRFPIDVLLNMSTVTERHPDILTQAAIHGGPGSAAKEENWEEDSESGKVCPPPAGEIVPFTSLPDNHPAMVYLVDRGYDPERLAEQFRLGFCTREYPYGQKKIFYRTMPGGWRDSPQHRVIFHSLIDGAPMTWQARVIERVSEDELDRFMLHPYAGGFYPGKDTLKILRAFKAEGHTGTPDMTWDAGREGYWVFMWSHTHTRSNPKASWMPVAPFDAMQENGTLRFKPSKYRTAKYSNRQMMGWDAAIARAAADPSTISWAVLCEGPLDAARVGPGGIAIIGSSLSPENADKLAANFHLIFTAFDADTAGKDATGKVIKKLVSTSLRAPILVAASPIPIPAGKDLGDLPSEEWQRILSSALRQSKRVL